MREVRSFLILSLALLAGCAAPRTVPPGSRPPSSRADGVLYGGVSFPPDSAPVRQGVLSSGTKAPSPAGQRVAARASRSFRDVVVYVDRVPEDLPPLRTTRVARGSYEIPIGGRWKVVPERRLHAVVEKGNAFVPRVLAIEVGDTVVFRNRDRVYHNAFSVSPVQPFNTGMLAPGDSKRLLFSQPGVVHVFCELHSRTAGYVLVSPTPVYTRPDAAGRWALRPLPAGEYVVRAWHPDFGERQWPVSLPREGRRLAIRF